MSPEQSKPKPTETPKPTTPPPTTRQTDPDRPAASPTSEPQESSPIITQPIGDPPNPESWQARTQPDKPFETDEDRERAERTPPDELEFSSARPSKEELEAARKVEDDAQPFERPAPPSEIPASPPAGEKETKA